MIYPGSVTTSTLEERDERFVVGMSTILGAGCGLFARQPLRPGDRLEVIGVLVAPGSAADECTRYADPYKYRFGDTLLVPLGYGAMVNHSPTPNMVKAVEDGRLFFEATRPIAAGEELLLCYSAYAQERFGLR